MDKWDAHQSVLFFLWKLWNKIIPIGEVVVRTWVCDELIYKCFDQNKNKIIEHLFLSVLFLIEFGVVFQLQLEFLVLFFNSGIMYSNGENLIKPLSCS